MEYGKKIWGGGRRKAVVDMLTNLPRAGVWDADLLIEIYLSPSSVLVESTLRIYIQLQISVMKLTLPSPGDVLDFISYNYLFFLLVAFFTVVYIYLFTFLGEQEAPVNQKPIPRARKAQ